MCDLLIETGWNVTILTSLFAWEIVNQILLITPNRDNEDILRWIHNPQGTFTSKSLYNLLDKKNSQQTDHLAKKIWNVNVSPRIKFFT